MTVDPASPIERLVEDNRTLVDYLRAQGEISFASTVEDNFRKMLLLACASYFEHRLTQDLEAFFKENIGDSSPILNFIRNKAMKRQYHTFFDWNATNANQFFGLFGSDFQRQMKDAVDTDEQLSSAIKAFIRIGQDRNRLVHNNFATQVLESSSEEIYAQYKQALYFLQVFPKKLADFTNDETNRP